MEVLESDELIFGPFIVIGEPPLRGLLTGLADGDMSLPPCSEMKNTRYMDGSYFRTVEILKLPVCLKLSTRPSVINNYDICLYFIS